VVAFVLVVSPWAYRNWAVAGSPFYTLRSLETVMGTRTHSGNTLYRSFDPAPPGLPEYTAAHPREIYEKLHDASLVIEPAALSLAGLVFTSFFLVAILVPLGNEAFDRLRLALYAVICLVAIGLSFIVPDRRGLLPAAPTVIVVAAVFFYQLLDLRLRPLSERLRTRWATIAVVLLLGLHSLPLLLQLMPGRSNTPFQPTTVKRAVNELNHLTSEMSGGSQGAAVRPVYTDLPWVVAWYGDRPAIWLPQSDIDVRRMEQQIGPVRWLVLTPQIIGVAQGEKAQGWAELWERGLRGQVVAGGWRVRQRFANGSWVLFERVATSPPLGSIGGGEPAAPAAGE